MFRLRIRQKGVHFSFGSLMVKVLPTPGRYLPLPKTAVDSRLPRRQREIRIRFPADACPKDFVFVGSFLIFVGF